MPFHTTNSPAVRFSCIFEKAVVKIILFESAPPGLCVSWGRVFSPVCARSSLRPGLLRVSPSGAVCEVGESLFPSLRSFLA